jgi:hypothetical protein
VSSIVNLEILKGEEVRFTNKLYTIASLKTLIIIIGKLVLTLINISIKVNVISHLLAYKLGLLVSKSVLINIFALASKESKFSSLYTDIDLSISEISYNISV